MKERHPTEILIEKARDLLSPSPVKLGHLPQWFASACRTALKKHHIPIERYDLPETLMYKVAETASKNEDGQSASITWIDHWGSTVHNGRQAFVTEPYLSAQDVANAVKMAKMLDLEIDIDSNSWWFPGETTRIAFLKPKD